MDYCVFDFGDVEDYEDEIFDEDGCESYFLVVFRSNCVGEVCVEIYFWCKGKGFFGVDIYKDSCEFSG